MRHWFVAAGLACAMFASHPAIAQNVITETIELTQDLPGDPYEISANRPRLVRGVRVQSRRFTFLFNRMFTGMNPGKATIDPNKHDGTIKLESGSVVVDVQHNTGTEGACLGAAFGGGPESHDGHDGDGGHHH